MAGGGEGGGSESLAAEKVSGGSLSGSLDPSRRCLRHLFDHYALALAGDWLF